MHAAASTRVVQTHHFALGMVSCAQFWTQPGACAPCWSPVAHSERIQGTPRDPQAHADPRWAYPDAQGKAPGVCRGVCCSLSPQAGHVSGVRGGAHAPGWRICACFGPKIWQKRALYIGGSQNPFSSLRRLRLMRRKGAEGAQKLKHCLGKRP